MIWRRITSGTVRHVFDSKNDAQAICGRDTRYGVGTWSIVPDNDDVRPCQTCLYQLQLRGDGHG